MATFDEHGRCLECGTGVNHSGLCGHCDRAEVVEQYDPDIQAKVDEYRAEVVEQYDPDIQAKVDEYRAEVEEQRGRFA